MTGPEAQAVQAEVCRRHGVSPIATPGDLKVGVARNVREGTWPLNGLRIRPDEETSGWFLWAGEVWSDDPDFFAPVHARHLLDWCPAAVPFLGLPPGWRFLVAPGHEDAWFDPALLDRP